MCSSMDSSYTRSVKDLGISSRPLFALSGVAPPYIVMVMLRCRALLSQIVTHSKLLNS